jgi:hypothetical protein
MQPFLFMKFCYGRRDFFFKTSNVFNRTKSVDTMVSAEFSDGQQSNATCSGRSIYERVYRSFGSYFGPVALFLFLHLASA